MFTCVAFSSFITSVFTKQTILLFGRNFSFDTVSVSYTARSLRKRQLNPFHCLFFSYLGRKKAAKEDNRSSAEEVKMGGS